MHAELPLTAQAMLLRTLSEGEVIPVGESRARRVDVRVIAATNRALEPLVEEGSFRRDLYYRLRYLHVHIPPVRERGDDWELIARHCLNRLGDRTGVNKEFSDDALAHLRTHSWPGNVREVKSVVETGFHMSDGALICPANVTGAMTCTCSGESGGGTAALVAECLDQMMSGKGNFWTTVHKPFMARDMNRVEARAVVAAGLRLAHESYIRMLPDFGVEEGDYLKFMDFLRHNHLKPER